MTRPEQRDVLTRQLQGVSKVPVPFHAGWADFGSGYEGASYSKHGRVVTLQGMVTKTAGTPGAGDVIFSLPENFRPAADLPFGAWTSGGAGRVDVQSDGDVVWQAGGATETEWMSLNGVRFVV